MEALAAALFLALLFVCVKFVAYRATHPHTDDDVAAARRQSAKLSRASRDGRAYEQLVPYLPEFEQRFDRGDVRFIGAPIDLLVFDGLYDGSGELREIVFVEVKSGRPSLSRPEREVRRAVEEGRVRWDRIVLGR